MSATQIKLERETMFKWKKAYEEEAKDHATTSINMQKLITELEQELSKLRAQLDEANEVIGFYADTNNWSTKNGECDTYIDGVICGDDLYAPWSDAWIEVGGKRAKEALAKISTESDLVQT